MMEQRPIYTRLAFLLLWIFVFSIPIERSIQIPGLGTVSKLAGIIAMGAGVVAIALDGRIRVPGIVHVLLGAFVAWSALTLRWTISTPRTEERIGTYTQLLCLALLVWQLAPEPSQVLALLDAFMLGCFATAFDTVGRFLSGQQTFYERYATAGFDPNDLALMLALSLPVAYYLTLRRETKLRWLYLFQIAIVAGAIFLTASRGGVIAMAVGLSIVVWTLPMLPARGRAALILAMVITGSAAAALIPASSWKRIATLGSEISEGTLNSRTMLWHTGLAAFGNSAFQGVGSGAFPEVIEPILGRPTNFTPVAHNSYISVLVETGIVGFACFFSAIAFLAVQAFRMPWLERRFWLTLLAAWAIGVASLTWEHRKPTWLLLALLAAHAGALKRATVAVSQRRRAAMPRLVQPAEI